MIAAFIRTVHCAGERHMVAKKLFFFYVIFSSAPKMLRRLTNKKYSAPRLNKLNNISTKIPDYIQKLKKQPAEVSDTGKYIGNCLESYKGIVKDTVFEKAWSQWHQGEDNYISTFVYTQKTSSLFHDLCVHVLNGHLESLRSLCEFRRPKNQATDSTTKIPIQMQRRSFQSFLPCFREC